MSWISSPGYRGHLQALLAGALVTLALAPFNYWPLALLSVALHYVGLGQLTPRQAAVRGWYYGFGLFLAGTSWVYVSIHDFGAASPPLAAGLTLGFVAGLGLFYALAGWLWARFFRGTNRWLNALAFASLTLVLELFRGWFLTGFPWLYLGYSQVESVLAGWAPIGGVWLVSWLIALSATLSCEALRTRQWRSVAVVATVLSAIWLGGWALQSIAWTHAKAAPLTVTAIQGNIAQELKWQPGQLRAQLELYRSLSAQAPQSDLLIWPETAIPVLAQYAQGYIDEQAEQARARNGAFISGIPVYQANAEGQMRYYNGVFSTGSGEGLYLKQKLVPFGEYVPLQEVLRGLIEFFDLPMSDFARGPSSQALLTAKEYLIAPFICYEVVYPNFAAGLAKHSDLLLTISNDAWFGRSIGPLQHLQMAQMRALESGRWMIRATNNGVTVLIDPKGRIQQQIEPFSQAVLTGSVVPMQGLTPFLRTQVWPLLVVCVVLLSVGRLNRRHYGTGGAR